MTAKVTPNGESFLFLVSVQNRPKKRVLQKTYLPGGPTLQERTHQNGFGFPSGVPLKSPPPPPPPFPPPRKRKTTKEKRRMETKKMGYPNKVPPGGNARIGVPQTTETGHRPGRCLQPRGCPHLRQRGCPGAGEKSLEPIWLWLSKPMGSHFGW